MALNPIKKIRYDYDLSQAELADLADINRQTVIRTEQGLYSNVPPRLISAVVNAYHCDARSINSAYHDFVRETRRNNFGKLSTTLPPFNSEEHPFMGWRHFSGLSLIEVCKLYCVHSGTLTRFENSLLMQSLPGQLKDALIDSGYPIKMIYDLETRYILYREKQLADLSRDTERMRKAVKNITHYLVPVGASNSKVAV